MNDQRRNLLKVLYGSLFLGSYGQAQSVVAEPTNITPAQRLQSSVQGGKAIRVQYPPIVMPGPDWNTYVDSLWIELADVGKNRFNSLTQFVVRTRVRRGDVNPGWDVKFDFVMAFKRNGAQIARPSVRWSRPCGEWPIEMPGTHDSPLGLPVAETGVVDLHFDWSQQVIACG